MPDSISHVRDAEQLANVAGRIAGLSSRVARQTLEAVITVLVQLVPEEETDILAVLPSELRELWLSTTTPED